MQSGRDTSNLIILFVHPLTCSAASNLKTKLKQNLKAVPDTQFNRVGDVTVQVKVSTTDVEGKLDDEDDTDSEDRN
jgi:hypothetical protein